jgi:AraC-like DNA-binding protein
MSDQILRLESIAEVHRMLGLPSPKHPLVSLLDVTKIDFSGVPNDTRIAMHLYSIWLKDSSCSMRYGRNQFDFNDGVLVFTAPDQVISGEDNSDGSTDSGWVLIFHPDLIRRSPLGTDIAGYTFFGYDNHEALHLSEEERTTLTDCVMKIKGEYEQRIDGHSQKVIVSALDLTLSYCSRFYERQFHTRENTNKDVVARIDALLAEYYEKGQATEYGAPSIHFLAEKVNLSSGYLSDLLKKESGRSGKEYINHFLVERAKTLLLGSDLTVNEIAYDLGYNYPHYFSRLFKSKTGMSPNEYRKRE